jgi:hypothetical protein
MDKIIPYKLFESLVDQKIQILKDLTIDLQDLGLVIEIWKEGKMIHLLIEDKDDVLVDDNYEGNYYEDDDNLYNREEISEFDETLKSYGMNYRSKKGGGDKIWYEFDKWSKMTKSPLLK